MDAARDWHYFSDSFALGDTIPVCLGYMPRMEEEGASRRPTSSGPLLRSTVREYANIEGRADNLLARV